MRVSLRWGRAVALGYVAAAALSGCGGSATGGDAPERSSPASAPTSVETTVVATVDARELPQREGRRWRRDRSYSLPSRFDATCLRSPALEPKWTGVRYVAGRIADADLVPTYEEAARVFASQRRAATAFDRIERGLSGCPAERSHAPVRRATFTDLGDDTALLVLSEGYVEGEDLVRAAVIAKLSGNKLFLGIYSTGDDIAHTPDQLADLAGSVG